MLVDQQQNDMVVVDRNMENTDSVETLVLNQEDRPGTHRTICQVS